MLLQILVYASLCATVDAVFPEYSQAFGDNIMQDREELITHYFNQNYSYKDIVKVLLEVHGIALGYLNLKRILRQLNLRRRVPLTNNLLQRTLDAIQNELRESGQCLGYRTMWKRLWSQGISVPRRVVQIALRILDKNGVERRKRRILKRRMYVNPGPNFVWHTDGYDKLKPYGFAIHGAIDGFSRKILWLSCGITNNNPNVVGLNFVEAIRQYKCVPCLVRSDKGTENVHIARIQKYLRANHDDMLSGENSYVSGKSSANQRIESFWAILRKQCANFWMNLFKDMTTIGLLNNADYVHVLCLRFCFMELVTESVQRMAIEWNQHHITARKAHEGTRGKPDMMYHCPRTYNTVSYGSPFDLEEMIAITERLEDNVTGHDYPHQFLTLVNTLIPDWKEPRTVTDALNLYVKIREEFERI